MESKIEELYTKDGKELFDLIQEWINENNILSYYKKNKKDIETTEVVIATQKDKRDE